ncbi:hypothetical protein GLOTRDRAFT_104018 [Gloeophyllum trabeum ATCC 11539]|uniref:Enhancer of mRNA-decapping protein 4 WD40 repeat region domain-containing protein n=1 Tax=Gloeophyllum trabeum (strain ATCC 11539 / FP-39264 / Madison 617) TaxID=670483 RepID=S7RTR6_GLOTA|nr:uncharacterized protein GLOTRDRAFT_104018 [Gloeophyllum trabeum ATCC 11539]EPQ58070.1 hypothetical protein GLOTRDRAFT_104018 [Gloeophyllum trabeum ATCC 11539]
MLSQQARVSPPLSLHESTRSSPPNHLDSLFQNLNAAPAGGSGISYGPPVHNNNSAPATPMSSMTASSAPGAAATDRQSALLSLLGSVGSSAPAAPEASASEAPAPQQIPTPPGSAQRAGYATSNEARGNFLLEQLMSGNAPRSDYTDSQRNIQPSGSSPSYIDSSLDTPSHHENDIYDILGASFGPHEASREPAARPSQYPAQQPPPQPPSPTRKSMFDFVSPFDALASSSSSAKKKPAPAEPPSEDSWTSVSVSTDPKRKSVENLMDQLTRGQPPLPAPQRAQAPQSSYDPYQRSDDSSAAEQAGPILPPPPLPPKPAEHVSPRASPPKVAAQHRQQQPRSTESPLGQPGGQGNGPPGRRDKESSPVPRSKNGGHDGRGGKAAGQRNKSRASPGPHTQNIFVDVSQPLDEIQAPRDAVKSTAIALVKVDSTFLPGTTIGATHWVAYAMTRGRIRVISRSSGDRTLLQLPPIFPQSTAVTDMAVYRNRLAGVTSDGGFVVWDLPEVITDDVPGQLLLCVYPSSGAEALHSVKWHPKDPDTLAVASESKVYLINIADAAHAFGGDPISQSELSRTSHIFNMSAPLISFDFDVYNYAIATISEDSALTYWSIRDRLPFWSQKIRGEDLPSSITIVDNGVVIGRKNGTIFQLLPIMSKNVLSSVKFVNGDKDDPDMFGHANYDSRIQTLWIANNRRDSMIALKINIELPETHANGDEVRGAFDRVVEFGGPKPTIHFVILTGDADPHGDEARAACVAAKVPPGELALVAFSVHSGGVDQVLIRKEWYDSALASVSSRFPTSVPPVAGPATRGDIGRKRQVQSIQDVHGPLQQSYAAQSVGLSAAPARPRTPPSEEVDSEQAREEGRFQDMKGKAAKGKSVGWKDGDSGKERAGKEEQALADPSVPSNISKEMKRMEESLHTRLGRLIGKELDKQHQRLEEVRVSEQAADFARQEKLLKLISNELTKNTTRVVEMAVKNEVQNSVLPSLENITKNEVKSLVNGQIAKGVSDAVKQSLPNEIERMLLRPDVSTHFARNFSSTVTPIIERQVKDAVTKTLIPAYSQQTSSMQQDISHEIRSELATLRKDIMSWQTETLRGHESLIRELEQNVRTLSDQVKYLSMNASLSVPSSHHALQNRASPVPSSSQTSLPQYNQSHMRQPSLPTASQSSAYAQSHGPYQPLGPSSVPGPWMPPNIAAPQASHPIAPPPPPPPPVIRQTPPATNEEWDDTYLAVLGTQDPRQLRELLARSNPEVIMPLSGPSPLSQAVVLTLVHRLAAAVGETSPVDESFKSSLWWLQRAASILNTNDPLISPYIARVLPNVQQMLNTTRQRLSILPGGSPQLQDSARVISDVQDVLSRKPL